MVFSSHIFVFYFLPLVLAAYYLLPVRYRHIGLSLFSYFFYGWANPYFVFLMFGTTAVNYACGLVIENNRPGGSGGVLARRGVARSTVSRMAVGIAVAFSLANLFFFKYFNFGVESYNALVNAMGIQHLQWDTFFRVTLPLGISFYTFQAMSYPIDIYRGDAKATKSFGRFACYVSMFPQLVAGPIIRFREVASQLTRRTHSLDKFTRGVTFVILGLSKKIILANGCGKIADTCFDSVGLNALDAWYGAIAYSFQIYFDFGGYSDMAIGLGLMLGFVFPKNFDSPYLSASITEFWRRWHISLSTWLRDYLYIPLGGNRKGGRRTYVNLFVVMLLGGLWHGASWNFVLWGGIHGLWLGFERFLGKRSIYQRAPRAARVALTFAVVTVAWVFFRAETLGAATGYLASMFGAGQTYATASVLSGLVYQPFYLGCFMLAAAAVWGLPQTWDFTRNITWSKAVYISALFVISLLLMTSQAYNPFIYFVF